MATELTTIESLDHGILSLCTRISATATRLL
jgi:hypothetical protein